MTCQDARNGRLAPAAVGSLIAAIGTPGFAQVLHGLLAETTGADLSSVFLREAARGAGAARISLLHACGDHPDKPEFAMRASLAYARDYWRADRDINRAASCGLSAPSVVRRRAGDLPLGSWRRELYETAGVAERLSLMHGRDPITVINAYVFEGRDGFGGQAADALTAIGPILIAAIERDRAMRAGMAGYSDEDHLAGQLAGSAFRLSAREAQVVSAMMLGHTQEEIAQRQRIARETVITYRRRAYGKLGVANSRDLRALHRRIVRADPSLAPPG
ncbi:helix-turn-helix transcriptional regulator [Novosphingobium aquimarinum]|uniref:helix-turn-helix transcriptional regulator n=1 Tax=Novosphingobium aquimarinum TaxID=2682494 RepID=UPI0018DD63BB|nr:helix-turn-helix domain-containing protein [Novosphingobium aquimarinum]